MTHFKKCHVEHIPREENAKVDALSKYASSKIAGTVYYKILKTPIVDINCVVPISQGTCWMGPIKAHLESYGSKKVVRESSEVSSY